LSESVGATGTKVGPWDISETVSDSWETDTIDKNGGGAASETHGSGRVSGVVDAVGDHGDNNTDTVLFEVVSLDAVDTVAVGIDGSTTVDSASDAIALNEVVELTLVATHAVKMSWIPENAARGSGGVIALSLDLHG
jgi:hypothetical protein